MLAVCTDRRGVHVGRGCASDAGGIVKHPRRGIRASLVDPKGRVRKGLGRRPASPRDTVLTQDLENAVQSISITWADS